MRMVPFFLPLRVGPLMLKNRIITGPMSIIALFHDAKYGFETLRMF